MLALPDFFASRHNDIGDAIDLVRMHVLRAIEHMAEQLDIEGGRHVTTVTVFVHNMLFALKTASSHLHTDVARHTKMAPHLQGIAQNVVANLEGMTGTAVYNSIHLRVEADFDAASRMGGELQQHLDHHGQLSPSEATSSSFPWLSHGVNVMQGQTASWQSTQRPCSRCNLSPGGPSM